MRLVFADNALGNSEAPPENSGWQTMHEGENAPGTPGASGDGTTGTKKAETDPVVLKPVRKKKRRGNPQAGTNLGLHRNMGRTNYGGDPAKYAQPYTPWKDDSTREFYYAPGESGLTGKLVFTAKTWEEERAEREAAWDAEKKKEREARKAAMDILGNPDAPAKSVKRLCHAADDQIRHAALEHPNAPVEELERMSKSVRPIDREHVAANPNLPASIAVHLAKTPHKDVQMAVANNPRCAPEALGILSKSRDKEILAAVADNPNTPADMAKFLRENSEEYQERLLKKTDLDAATLDKLATTSPYRDIRMLAIHHPNISEKTLLKLTSGENSQDTGVMYAVASSESLTPTIAARVLAFGDAGVLWGLAANPKCPDNIIRKMADEIKAYQANGKDYGNQGPHYRSLREAVIERLPVEERVAMTSTVPEGFNKDALKNVDYKRYALRMLEKAMQAAGVTGLKKADLSQPAFQRFKGNPYVEQVFADNKGAITLEQLQQARAGNKQGQEYYVHHGKYDNSGAQSEKEWAKLPRKTYSLGLKDANISPETLAFIDEIAPKLKHSQHSIGLGGKNLGWILWKDLSGLEPFKGEKQKTYLIEQVQSDWRGLLPKLRKLGEDNPAVAEQVKDFEEKHGGADVLDRVQKEIDDLVKNYPEKLIGSFLEDAAGATVYMTDVTRAQSLTSMSPTTAKIIYQDAAKRFGFEPDPQVPGYQMVVAGLKPRLVFADLYQDDEANQKGTGFDAPQGASAYQGDTNYTPGPQGNPARPVNFSDRWRRIDYKKGGYGKSGLPEPPPTPGVDYANAEVEWPLGSESEEMGVAARLVYAAAGFDGLPKAVQEKVLRQQALDKLAADPLLAHLSEEDKAELVDTARTNPGVYAELLAKFQEEAVLADMEPDEREAVQAIEKQDPQAYADFMVKMGVTPAVAAPVSAPAGPSTGQPGKEKTEPRKRRGYNVLKDPALDALRPEITPEERLFTNIRDWKEDSFHADPKRLDSVTRNMLDKKKVGDGNYFSWKYIGEDDVEAYEEKQKAAGQPSAGIKPTLIIQRKPAWKDVQKKISEERDKRGATQA